MSEHVETEVKNPEIPTAQEPVVQDGVGRKGAKKIFIILGVVATVILSVFGISKLTNKKDDTEENTSEETAE